MNINKRDVKQLSFFVTVKKFKNPKNTDEEYKVFDIPVNIKKRISQDAIHELYNMLKDEYQSAERQPPGVLCRVEIKEDNIEIEHII